MLPVGTSKFSRGLGEVLLALRGRVRVWASPRTAAPRSRDAGTCHLSATSHLPPVFWPACVCCGDLSFSLLFDGVSRRWRRVPPIRHRHDPRHTLETPSPRPRGECHHASRARAVAATSARNGASRDDSARRRHCRAASRTWSLSTNHLLINLRSDKARKGNANLPIISDFP